ncbi:MAG: sensor histidine kinase [Spirochaetota bacterium]
MKFKSYLKRGNIIITVLLGVFTLYFGTIIFLLFQIDPFSLFQTITQNRVFLISLLMLFSVMFFLVLYNLFQIVSDRIKNVEGSKFRLRLTLFFLIITSIPIIPLSIISYNLISRSINLWFVGGIEDSLMDAVGISKELYRTMSGETVEEWEEVCSDCSAGEISTAGFKIIDGVLRFDSGTGKLSTLYSKNTALKNEVASFNIEESDLQTWKRMESGSSEYILVPVKGSSGKNLILVRKIPDRIKKYTTTISTGLQNYRTLKIIREPIKGIVVLFFMVVAMPFVLLSFYLGLIISREVTVPIRELAIATRKVADDNLDYRINQEAKDELKLLIDSFNKMTTDLRLNKELLKHTERSMAWQDIARRIAHEIKNPLTPIKLSAERLLRLYKKNDQYKQVLSSSIERIVGEVNNINDMVNEFSSFARLPDTRMGKHDIVELVYEIIHFLEDTYKQVEFTFHHEHKELYVWIDRNQVKRAILNVVYNGINAVDENGNIRLKGYTSEIDSGRYILSITDNGVGIDDEIKEHIFDPYFSKNGTGSGLGLSIVERIMVDNRARIWFESQPGRTTFYLEFTKV